LYYNCISYDFNRHSVINSRYGSIFRQGSKKKLLLKHEAVPTLKPESAVFVYIYYYYYILPSIIFWKIMFICCD